MKPEAPSSDAARAVTTLSSVGPEWIDLEGVANMRDLGGLPTTDGGRTAPRRLIRSDNLQTLTEADVARLVRGLGVRDIVDLRSEAEIHIEGPGPMRRVEGLVHHEHSLFAAPAVASEDALPWHGDDADRTAADYWGDHYLGYLRGRPDSVAAALGVVAHSEGAVVVHCAAGKDRTGTVVGLALDVAGVPHDVIVEDYVATGERIAAVMERLLDRPAYAEHVRGHTVAEQTPVPQAMETILRFVGERGGAGGWLREQGWSADQVARLRERLRA